MIIFLHGTDSYLIRQQLNDLINKYRLKNPSGLNIGFFNNKNFELIELKNRLSSASMFEEKKLVVLENIFDKTSVKETLLKFLKDSSLVKNQDIFLIFIQYLQLVGDKRIDNKKLAAFQKDKFFKYLKDKAYKSQELNTLTGSSLTSWILREFQKRNSRIDRSALNFLLINLPNDLWLLAKEIEKLSLYSSIITLKEIRDLLVENTTPDIFKTIDELGLRNKKQALDLLHQHLRKGESPLYLLSMLVFQFRNIYLLKKLQLARKPLPKNLSLHPFVQRKALAQSRNFSLEELQNIYQRLFEIDLAIKTGQIEPVIALDLFVAKVF